MNFATPTIYLHALLRDPSLAIMPLQMAADLRGVSRAAIDRMLGLGQLGEIRIGDTRYVQASSLVALEHEHDERVATVRAHLEDCARRGELVTYEPVMALIGLSPHIPADRRAIGRILGAIAHATYREHGVLLSVIVHRKVPVRGRTRPSPGFLSEFRDLVEPGWKDDDDLIDREIERIWQFYGSANS